MRFRQEGHLELKCYSALITFSSKTDGVLESHVSTVIRPPPMKKEKKRIKTEFLSLKDD